MAYYPFSHCTRPCEPLHVAPLREVLVPDLDALLDADSYADFLEWDAEDRANGEDFYALEDIRECAERRARAELPPIRVQHLTQIPGVY